MIKNLFPTPIFLTKIDENVREEILQWIYSNIDLNDPPGDGKYNIFDFVVPKTILKDFCIEKIKEYTGIDDDFFLRGWVTGSSNGYYTLNHNHSCALFSSVLYLDAPEGGNIVLDDPRGNANRGYPPEYREFLNLHSESITPETGDMLIMPGFLYHGVPVYLGKKRRIALVIDFYINEMD